MGITSAMFSGVSGLNTNSKAMEVIGNNLANTNTIGFKSSRAVFSDLLSSSVSGSGGTSQVGRGVGLSSVDKVLSQGTFESTSSGTDVAIEGDSFFVVSALDDEMNYYTRAGAFSFDDDGYLVNSEGYVVQGKAFDEDGNLIAGDASNIQVTDLGLSSAKATTEVTFETNLDSNSELVNNATFPNILPGDSDSYNYMTSCPVYDSLGEAHTISVYWRLADEATNTWEMGYTVDGVGTGAVPDQAIAIATPLDFDPSGLIDTNGDGNPDGNADDPLEIALNIADWGNGAALAQEITLKFNCTQYDSASVVIGQNQDGYAAGELTEVAINSDGVVIASYSNGEQTSIAQLVLAKFQNPGGLASAGSNLWEATTESGTIRVGLPGDELGTIFTNSLEQSNVDMSLEFVKMITTQRGFQANSKIISTIDEMLSELINLKR
ncbi:MAG: flagellar hook-basal body protein [Desulfobulbus propionicus]|nr:MAG: flagellar hook-basal body protein [Desulfobulbus propionicus]